MAKPSKSEKRKAKQKAQKRQRANNDQTQADRLSAALEALCAPILPEYVDDGNGPDLVGRKIVWGFGLIAWNLAITGQEIPPDYSFPNKTLNQEEQALFRNEIISLIQRKNAEFPNFNTTIRDCAVAMIKGQPHAKARPGITVHVVPPPLKTEPAAPLTPERIRDIRKKLALTQTQLGKRMGISASTISAWEHEKSTPQSESANKLRELEASVK